MYSAQGPNASWEWLETISPCIVVLRELVTKFNGTLGSHQGSKHAPPDLSKDLASLIDSLDSYQVYTLHPGRIIENSKGHLGPARDILSLGHSQLVTPLKDYNAHFRTLQERRASRPLVDRSPSASPNHSSSECELPNSESEQFAGDSLSDSEGITPPDSDGSESESEWSLICSTDEDQSPDGSSDGQSASGDVDSVNGTDSDSLYDDRIGEEDILMCSIEDDEDVEVEFD